MPGADRYASGPVGDDQAEIAQMKAQLANAQWELSQTVFYAPSDGTVINLQLRPGQMATALGMLPVMTFVENEFQVIALYDQNELHQVRPGDEAEFALETYPGRIIKASVNSIVWAQGQGQIPMSQTIPQTGTRPLPPGGSPCGSTSRRAIRNCFLQPARSGMVPSTPSTGATFRSCAR
jgi:multidrug resistance efflux pump